MSMLLKSFFLIRAVGLVAAELLILAAKLFNIATRAEQTVLFFFQSEFSFVDLAAQVIVAMFLSFKVLGSSEVLTSESIIITTQGAAFTGQVRDTVTSAS